METTGSLVRKLFSNITPTYDFLNRFLSFGADQRWRAKGTRLLPHGADVRVLDLACGTLDLALAYLKQGEGEVFGVDFAMPMLEAGRRKAVGVRKPVLGSRLKVVCGDGLQLPFPDHFFDAAMCAWGVRNFSDNAAGLKEMRRVLKPGGLFLVLEFFKPSTPIGKIFSKTYGRYVMPVLGGWISKNKKAYEYLNRSIQKFLSQKEYEKLLTDTGFEIRRSKNLSGGISSLILAQNCECNS